MSEPHDFYNASLPRTSHKLIVPPPPLHTHTHTQYFDQGTALLLKLMVSLLLPLSTPLKVSAHDNFLFFPQDRRKIHEQYIIKNTALISYEVGFCKSHA